MRKIILLIILVLFLGSSIFISIAKAEDEWQTITDYGITLSLPAEWVKLEEKMGFSEKEAAWYKGNIENPDQFLILARGPEVSSFLEMFIETETEDSELVEDTQIDLGGIEARMVTMKNNEREANIWFIAASEVFEDGEGVFLNITSQTQKYEEFTPILQKIMDSIVFEKNS